MCLAVPGQIVEIREGPAWERTGCVDFNGARRDVSLVFVPEARVGDFVIVHVGVALAVLDQAEARESLAAWAEYAARLDAPEDEAPR